MSDSLASSLASLPGKERAAILASFDDAELAAIEHDWLTWARPSQLAPTWQWGVWLLLAGRGFGKTRTGAEWVRARVMAQPQSHGALIAKTPADARDVMIEGESGLLRIGADHERPEYEPSKRRVTWPNGAWATIYSSVEYDTLRGPQHDWAWCDELAAWTYPRETFDNLALGLRAQTCGMEPQCVVTTTPRRIPLLRELLAREGDDVAVTRGSTFENAHNLAPAFLENIQRRYEGTTLGRQELYAELLDDVEGALWRRAMIDAHRREAAPQMASVIVGVDPAITATDTSDETGIIVAGVDHDRHGYVIADHTLSGSPHEWASRAVAAYREHRADRIVAEANQGGDMVRHTIASVDPNVPVELVHASRGKRTRAEPIAALYEQGRIHHVGAFAALEDQMCCWVPGEKSPDRMDALVWAFTRLVVDGEVFAAAPISDTRASGWRY